MNGCIRFVRALRVKTQFSVVKSKIISRFNFGQIEGGKTTFVMRSLNRMAKRSILRSDGSTCISHDTCHLLIGDQYKMIIF